MHAHSYIHMHTHTHFHAFFSILFVSRSLSSFWSALHPQALQNLKGKISLLWFIKHEHPVVHSLPPMSSSTLVSFHFPFNPISNWSFWQFKTGWWKLCKCGLFVMLFCMHPHHAFLTLKKWGCTGLGSKERELQSVYARCICLMIFSVTWEQLQKLSSYIKALIGAFITLV